MFIVWRMSQRLLKEVCLFKHWKSQNVWENQMPQPSFLSVTMSVTLVCLRERPSILTSPQKAYCFDVPRLIYRMETEELSKSTLHKHLPPCLCFSDNRHDSLMGLQVFREYLLTATGLPALLSHPGLSALRVVLWSRWRVIHMTPADCQERHLPWIMERDAVVGTSLQLIYSACTLPGLNVVQIYRLRTAQMPRLVAGEEARRRNVRNAVQAC